LEATDKDGVQFGSSGLIESATNSSPKERFAKIEAALKVHQNGCLASDDISLMLIECP
jgi:serine phosphatase RsbU (regulator of sigma subunit)